MIGTSLPARPLALAFLLVTGCSEGRPNSHDGGDREVVDSGSTDSGSAADGETDHGDSDASVRDGAMSIDDNDSGTSEALPLKLRFDAISLESDPKAITDFAFLPGTNELLVLQKGHGQDTYGGTVIHYKLEGEAATLLGTFDIPESYDYHDCGLLGLTFDPEFVSNHYVYFAYCDSHDYSRISRHLFDPSNYASIGPSGVEVIRVGEDNAPNAWHNVGEIGFDSAGNLWALFGEKNDGARAQELDINLGKVVRINPRRGAAESGFEQVSSNPFVAANDSRRPEIVAYGLRSPWRGAMDSSNRLWVADTGETKGEEINVLPSWTNATNFGWPLAEGPCTSNCVGLTDPLISWDHSLTSWAALEDPDAEPTMRRVPYVGLEYVVRDGVDRYAGRFAGRMTYGDFCGGWVRAASLNASGEVVYNAHAGHLTGASGWDQGSDGFVYVSTYGNCFTGPYKKGGLYRAVLAD